jgi:hypothetical protein
MPAVDVVRQHSNTELVKNVLFLGDGFADTANERALFNRVAADFADQLFRFIPPFTLAGIAEHFNIFSAFTPSSSSGISCLVPVDSSGTRDISGSWRLRDKPSAFLMAYVGERGIRPTDADAEKLIKDFVESLSHPFESADTSSIPRCWNTWSPTTGDPIEGKDHGLIVILTNDDVRDGNTLHLSGASAGDPAYGVAVSIGRGRTFNLGAIDFTWPYGPDVRDHQPLVATLPFNRYQTIDLTHVIIHELAHSHFDLRDEYVDANYDPAAATGAYSHGVNVTSRSEAQDAALHFTNVPWKADMHSDVRTYVEATGPLVSDPDCGTYTPADLVRNFARQLPSPPQFRRRKLNHQIIGLYEGAAHQPCGVYRPAGMCKMRKSRYIREQTRGSVTLSWASEFCYVCQKAILSKIDPALVAALGPTPW